MRFDFIFFDSGGTLYNPEAESDVSPGQVASGSTKRVHALLDGMGVHLDFHLLEDTLARQEKACRQRLGNAYNFFRLMEATTAELQLPAGRETAACLADAYAGPRYESWLFPGTEDALQTLTENGYGLGIIANTAWPGFSMDRAFSGVGLLPFFSIRVYSGDLGIAKPDPAIFHHAARLGGLEGKRILYVGNDVKADIEGASAVGWSTAFRRANQDPPPEMADMAFDHISELVHYCLDH